MKNIRFLQEVENEMKLGNITKALEGLLQLLNQTVNYSDTNELRNTIVLSLARLNQSKKDFLLGIINENNYHLQTARVSAIVMEILDNLKKATEKTFIPPKPINLGSPRGDQSPQFLNKFKKVDIVFNENSEYFKGIDKKSIIKLLIGFDEQIDDDHIDIVFDKYIISFSLPTKQANRLYTLYEKEEMLQFGIENIRLYFEESENSVAETLTAVIVEDEPEAIVNLQNLLRMCCPNVEIIGTAGTVKEGIEVINRTKPQLVFLDISLPDGLVFSLLDNFDDINFEIIFVTAFDRYAIRAIEYAAIAYVTKPVERDELKSSVNRALKKRHLGSTNSQYSVLKESLKFAAKTIVLNTDNGLAFVELDDILAITKENNTYTKFLLKRNTEFLSKDTFEYLARILEDSRFVKINNSLIINYKNIERINSLNKEHEIEFDGDIRFPIDDKTFALIIKKLKTAI